MTKAKTQKRKTKIKAAPKLLEALPPPPPPPSIYRPPYTHEAVGTDITPRDPPAWLKWWYIWRFRRSLKHATLGYSYGTPAGWRRRCLNAVQNWQGGGGPKDQSQSDSWITRFVRPIMGG